MGGKSGRPSGNRNARKDTRMAPGVRRFSTPGTVAMDARVLVAAQGRSHARPRQSVGGVKEGCGGLSTAESTGHKQAPAPELHLIALRQRDVCAWNTGSLAVDARAARRWRAQALPLGVLSRLRSHFQGVEVLDRFARPYGLNVFPMGFYRHRADRKLSLGVVLSRRMHGTMSH